MTLLRRPSRRTATAVTLALAVGGLGSTAVATTLASAVDGSAATPVERFRAQAEAARAADTDAPGDVDLKNFVHVRNIQFPRPSNKPNAADQGTDIEFYSPTVTRVVDGVPQQVTLDIAVVGAYDRGAYLIDITNPENPVRLSQIVCDQKQNDIQIKKFGDRWVVVVTNDNSGVICGGPVNHGDGSQGGGLVVVDITNPSAPKKLYNVRIADGAHNFTWHPSKPVGWVSTGEIPGGVNHIPVVDFTNLDKPVIVADPSTEGSPHDITFSADGSRAYVASENNVRVYDSTDPKNPVLLQRGASIASYVHGADPTPDGKTLLVTDESLALGGFFQKGSTVCPGGGITFFDTTTPVLRPLSYAVANVQGHAGQNEHRACTAHVGSFTPDSKTYATGWYIGGVRVFDISNPSSPKEIGHAVMPDQETWSAKFYKGQYVYTGDLGRGFDVFRWTGPALGTKPLG